MSPREVAVAEAVVAVACGVTSQVMRDPLDRSSTGVLARWMFAAILKDLGCSWSAMSALVSGMRGVECSIGVLRSQRTHWQRIVEEHRPPHQRSALARHLSSLYESTYQAIRLRLTASVEREIVPA